MCCLMNKSRIISVCVKTFRINFRQTHFPRQSHCSDQIQGGIEGEEIQWHHNSQTTIGLTCYIQNTGLLQMYPATAQSMDSLHKVTRKLYQWEQHEWNVNMDIKKKTIQFWNFLITPHICITNTDVNICKVISPGSLEGRKCLLYASKYCQL